MADLEDWSPTRVKAALKASEIVLIDVRTPPEYMMEHVPGALLMPMAFFRAAALPTQDGKRIVLHCGSGMRSAKVGQVAIEAGVTPLAQMEGGLGAWKAAGLPYTGIDMATGAPKEMTQD
jgi:rhodanese-related sulfurtransferase